MVTITKMRMIKAVPISLTSENYLMDAMLPPHQYAIRKDVGIKLMLNDANLDD